MRREGARTAAALVQEKEKEEEEAAAGVAQAWESCGI